MSTRDRCAGPLCAREQGVEVWAARVPPCWKAVAERRPDEAEKSIGEQAAAALGWWARPCRDPGAPRRWIAPRYAGQGVIADEHGQVTGVLTILMDVEEFRDVERATQEARDAAEEASRAKSEFVGHMSHELHAAAIHSGFAELGMLRGRTQLQAGGNV